MNDELDVFLVGGLGSGIGVEALMSAAVDVSVGIDATEVVPVVEEGKDEFDAVLLGSGDGVIEASNAVFGVVIEILAGGVEDLVVDVG